MRRISPTAAALALLVALLLPVHQRAEGQTRPGEGSGTILYTRSPYEDSQIYSIEYPDGEPQQLTGSTPMEGQNASPRWSPDGQRVVFMSDRDGDWDIYSMAPDGSDVTQLLDREGFQWSPVWSPDGGRIAFTDDGPEGTGVHLMLDDGTYVRKLNTRNLIVSGEIDWGPCRRGILFTGRKGKWRPGKLYLIRPWNNRINEMVGTNDSRWTPGCNRIVFSHPKGAPESRTLYTINRHGNKGRYIPTEWAKTYDRYHSSPGWSPDGRLIAYSFMDHECFYCTELRVFDTVTGEDHSLVSGNEVWFVDPDWRPPA